MNSESKYIASIVLSAIGDAMGWITEFERNTQSLEDKFGTDRINKFYPWKKQVGGRFYGFIDTIKAGSYSDDTQLMLAVARSIQNNGSLDHNYFAKFELSNWMDYARGGGRTVKAAADKISRKSINWYNNFYSYKVKGEEIDYRESGANGAAMRVLPIALANLGNVEKIKEEIFCNSIITHGHPRAILGAMLYGFAVEQIIVMKPNEFSWEKYLTQIGSEFPKLFKYPKETRKEIHEWLKLWNNGQEIPFEQVYQNTLIEIQHYLRIVFVSIRNNSPVLETLKKLGCLDISTKGSGVSTVVAGIYLATKYHQEPLESILEAVNAIGTDTDSIAAFTGGLIGALHGDTIIPESWNSVQDREYLENIAGKLYQIAQKKYPSDIEKNYTNFKILNDPKEDDFYVNQEIEFIPLGTGKIVSIEKQPTLTKGKYTLIIEAVIENGQSILVSKILNDKV